MNKLIIFVNNENVFEFDKNSTLEGQQLAFLDKMDSDMKEGIKLSGELFRGPDSHQRSTFVAMNLIKALQQNNQAAIFASCAYLINRHADVLEVHANDHDNNISIEFIRSH